MWWACEDGERHVNMKQMATISIAPLNKRWAVYANEKTEQARYMIKSFDDRKEAAKLAQEIMAAENK